MAQIIVQGYKTQPSHGQSRCVTCSHSQIVQGSRESEKVTTCHFNFSYPRHVTWHVTECSTYEDKTRPNLFAMEKIAWKFSPDRGSRRAGILSPDDWRKQHPDEGDDFIQM